MKKFSKRESVTGTHVASFSGGRTSAYMVHLLEQFREKGADVRYVFMDTGAEHPETYKFIQKVVRRWKIDLVVLRVKYSDSLGQANSYTKIKLKDAKPDLVPWVGFLKKYGYPSISHPHCSKVFKKEAFTRYCQDNFNADGLTIWLGMRADEPGRVKERSGVRYLADISDFNKQDIIDWWSHQEFDLGIQEHLGNCVFCIKKSVGKLGLATKDEVEMSRQFLDVLTKSEVRDAPGRSSNDLMMYRHYMTFQQIIEVYADTPRNDIASRLRNSKMYETGACSESCEVFNDDDDDE